MVLHDDGSPYLHRLIAGEYLVMLLERRAFHLKSQNFQKSDPEDGVLPEACFAAPHKGPLERALNVNDDVLTSTALALNEDRMRRYIMCWTHDPSDRWRDAYGDAGTRFELLASRIQLEQMLGYEWKNGAYFPPRKQIDELGGAKCDAELKAAVYCSEDTPLPVVANPSATARKVPDLDWEKEFRIEVTDLGNHEQKKLIRWPITSFDELIIKSPTSCDESLVGRISIFAKNLGIKVGKQKARPGRSG